MTAETKSDLPMVNLNLAPPTAKASAAAPGNRGETIAKVGTIVSAILASSCCWLPLLLLAVGVSGAGIATALSTYRPLFMVVTFAFLGAAFYFTYRPRRAVAQTADCCSPQQVEVDCCGRPIATTADCCAATTATGGKGVHGRMMALNKAMLWVVTGLAVFFLFFPGYVNKLIGSDEQVITGNMRRIEVKVDGMTCEGCAPIAKKALSKAPGVLAVTLDYDRRLATIGTDPDQPVSEEAILESLKKVGFKGQLLDE